MKIKLIAAAVTLAAMSAPALADGNSHDNGVCLMRRDIDGWGAHGDKAVVINDKFGRKYLLSLAGLCSDLNWAFGVGVQGFGGASTCVDRGDHIVMRGGGTIGHNNACWVTKVERYTPEMEKAYKDELEAKRHDHS